MDTQREKFIQACRPLFWSVSDANLPHISDELLVETILNYGNLQQVRALIDLLGLGQVAAIFAKTTRGRVRNNFFPEVANYFNIYFQRHVPGYSV